MLEPANNNELPPIPGKRYFTIGEASEFEGRASKIIFYNNDNVHLLGAAKMKYENMTITSNKIVFSPRSGFINSNK